MRSIRFSLVLFLLGPLEGCATTQTLSPPAAGGMSNNQILGLIKPFYDGRGEWAGQYVLTQAVHVRTVEEGAGRIAAHVQYQFQCIRAQCEGTEQNGTDQRIFHFANSGGGWTVTRMDGYMSASF